jgi:cell division protein FtsI (penicillin-binding protein 3)
MPIKSVNGSEIVSDENAPATPRAGCNPWTRLSFLATRKRLLAVVLLFFTTVGATFSVATYSDDPWPRIRYQAETWRSPRRADIVDRNGVVLATSVAVPSLYADPRRVSDPKTTAAAIAKLLPGSLDQKEIERRLALRRSFVWIYRHMTEAQRSAVEALALPGLAVRFEEARVYPSGPLTAHIVGLTNFDAKGLSGIEWAEDARLPPSNKPLMLSIDVRIQDILMHELQTAIDRYSASGAAGIVVDASNGEIIALASLPTFNPNSRRDKYTATATFNRATLGSYEFGGFFDIFTAVLAMENGQTPRKTTGPHAADGTTIRNTRSILEPSAITEIIRTSSNAGMARIAEEAGAERQKLLFTKLGLLQQTKLETPERTSPLLPKNWTSALATTVSYGYGLAVTPVQVAAGICTVVNGGAWFEPTLLRRAPDRNTLGVKNLPNETSTRMRELLRSIAIDGPADVPGYQVGGKATIAKKVVGGSYTKDKLIVSFGGAFPMSSPRYGIFVMLDEPHLNAEQGSPHADSLTSGVSALVGRIVPRIGPLLDVSVDLDGLRHL